jgi:hypothetical protein
MTALSDYLESGLLHHVFRGETFPKPTNIAIALCSGVPTDSNNGTAIPSGGTLEELPSGVGNVDYGYRRYDLGDPSSQGDAAWYFVQDGVNLGSGLIQNNSTIVFPTALQDWGWVSGIAIVDSGYWGTGNMLMYAQLNNPRIIYQGDSVKFDLASLKIKFS